MEKMNLKAVRTLAIVEEDNAERARKCLKDGGYVCLGTNANCFAVLNTTEDMMKRLASRCGIQSYRYFQSAGSSESVSALLSIGVSLDEMTNVDDAIMKNAVEEAARWRPGNPDADALIDFTISRVGFSPFYWRHMVNKGLY